ncbi:hypothetical protein HDU78_009326 [Chytriomyces hyalinus]|nr:hypothetical protein HDU78_009326 [Chytriomyces hyalinus]
MLQLLAFNCLLAATVTAVLAQATDDGCLTITVRSKIKKLVITPPDMNDAGKNYGATLLETSTPKVLNMCLSDSDGDIYFGLGTGDKMCNLHFGSPTMSIDNLALKVESAVNVTCKVNARTNVLTIYK